VTWLFLALLALSDSKTDPTLNVCDVLKALPKYRNEIVTIRGEPVGTEEGTYLSAVECEKPLVVSGHTWAPESAISLIPPDSAFVEHADSPVPIVKVDPASSKLLSQPAADPKDRVYITIRGRLDPT